MSKCTLVGIQVLLIKSHTWKTMLHVLTGLLSHKMAANLFSLLQIQTHTHTHM